MLTGTGLPCARPPLLKGLHYKPYSLLQDWGPCFLTQGPLEDTQRQAGISISLFFTLNRQKHSIVLSVSP